MCILLTPVLYSVTAVLKEVYLYSIRNREETILFCIVLIPLTVVSLLEFLHDVHASDSAVTRLTTILIEVYLQCFTESVSLRDIGKPTAQK